MMNKLKYFLCLFVITILFIGISDLQASDAHYAKIIELDKQIVPNMASRDKIRLHFQILDEVAKIPVDATYFIKEINELLDITLRIVEKNQGILRHEECIYKLALLLKGKNLKDDSKEIKKLLGIMTENKRFRKKIDFTRYTNNYLKTAEVFEEEGFVKLYVFVVKNIIKMTFKFSRDRKSEVLRICDIISKKHKNSSDKRHSTLMFFAGNYF